MIGAAARLRLRPFDWRTRLLGGYLRKWVILGILIGVVAGGGAIIFFTAINWATRLFLGGIAGLTPPVPGGEGRPIVTPAAHAWLLPVATVLGGLLSGIIVFTLAPEAEGHGTDAAIDAFHERGGVIRSRIPPIKLLASAITIGSGGSAGREGPTAQIAAGFGSCLGNVFRLTPQDRRIALANAHSGEVVTLDVAIDGAEILAGRSLSDLRLPREALITTVFRNGAVLIPRGDLELHPGDRLQILTTPAERDAVLARLDAGTSPQSPAFSSPAVHRGR